MPAVSLSPGFAAPVASRGARDLLRCGRDLVDAQLWSMGRDIHHPDGNALLRRGFVRRCPPHGESGSTAYELALSGDRRIVLWGFAAFYGPLDAGPGLLLRRHPFAARLAEAASLRLPIWRLEQLPPTRAARTDGDSGMIWPLVGAAACVFAEYERWIRATLGSAHRARCDAERPRGVRRRQTVPCTGLAAAWTRLAADVRGLAHRGE